MLVMRIIDMMLDGDVRNWKLLSVVRISSFEKRTVRAANPKTKDSDRDYGLPIVG